MKKILIPVWFALAFLSINGQQKQTHYSSWNSINIKKTFNTQWFANAEFNIRRTNFLKDWEQFIIRPFIHYKLEKAVDFALGYSYIKNYNYSNFSTPIDVIEHNTFQQLTINHQLSKYTFNHRLRFEERFQQNVVEFEPDRYEIEGTKYKNRFRYKFQIAIPLKIFNPNKKLNFVVYDEAHLDFGNGLRPEKLDQNWMFFGVSFSATKDIKIRSGYHDIYINRENNSINNQIWETTITYNI